MQNVGGGTGGENLNTVLDPVTKPGREIRPRSEGFRTETTETTEKHGECES
jgi:hypothetical protein